MTELQQTERDVAHYRLTDLLGEGGAARTWRAVDGRDGSVRAIKELQLVKSANAKQVELFERECAILKELNHPQIPRFIETIVERRTETMSLYLVQELIDGRSLQQMVDAGTVFSPDDVVAVMRSCLTPLEYLHDRAKPLFHRDLKPSNILLRETGECVLVDFGAVREAIADPKAGGSSVVGTFGYMAPEQFHARAYPSTDLYALGATALHLVTGRDPGSFEIRRLKPDFHTAMPDDPHLAAILDLLLEPAAEDRYATVASLARALDRWETTRTEQRPAGERLRALLADTMQREAQRRSPTAPRSEGSSAASRATGPASRPPSSPSAAPAVTPATAPAGDGVAPTPRAASDAPLSQPPPAAAGAPRNEPARPARGRNERRNKSGRAGRENTAGSTAHTASPVSAAPDPTVPAASPASADGGLVVGESRRARTASGSMVSVQQESARALEFLLPGGQGARQMGLVVVAIGAVLSAWGMVGPVEYNAHVWVIAGAVLGAWGLALIGVPRTMIGNGDARLRQGGETTAARNLRIVKRNGPLGGAEWYAQFEYNAGDGLSYANRFRLPGAKSAAKIAGDASGVAVRYLDDDPSRSILVVRG